MTSTSSTTSKVFVYADGGSRGNPGVAGSGSLVVDAATKETVAEIVYAFTEKATNNVAEYRGLIEGLKVAAEVGAEEVYVFMDSKLVVEQMSGRWKIKHPDMQRLAVEARKLAGSFARITYTWIPREQNKDADALSNVAMDASAAGAPTGIVTAKSRLPVVGTSTADTAGKETGVDEPETAEVAGESGAWCGSESTPTRVILLRHGQTEMSAAKQYAGLRDVELTALGLSQAEAAARQIVGSEQVDAIITSPLQRCQQTAAAVAAQTGAGVTVDEGLIECDFGDYEGLTFAEADAQDPEAHSEWLRDPSIAPPGGEALADVYTRVEKTVAGIVEKHAGKTLVLVSHVNPIKAVLAQALGAGDGMFARLFLDLASVSIVDFLGPEAIVPAQVRSVNDIPYRR